jgi:hypothetical protein
MSPGTAQLSISSDARFSPLGFPSWGGPIDSVRLVVHAPPTRSPVPETVSAKTTSVTLRSALEVAVASSQRSGSRWRLGYVPARLDARTRGKT